LRADHPVPQPERQIVLVRSDGDRVGDRHPPRFLLLRLPARCVYYFRVIYRRRRLPTLYRVWGVASLQGSCRSPLRCDGTPYERELSVTPTLLCRLVVAIPPSRVRASLADPRVFLVLASGLLQPFAGTLRRLLASGLLQPFAGTLRRLSLKRFSLFSRAACCSPLPVPCGDCRSSDSPWSRERPAAALCRYLAATVAQAILLGLASGLLQPFAGTLR